jgi:DnaJ-domain-containing protein 1
MNARFVATFAMRILVSAIPFAAHAGAQEFEARGEATNYGLAASPNHDGLTGTLTWRVAATPVGIGRLTIASPLGGSGSTRSSRWADTLLILSFNAVGDTIAWLGRVDNDLVAGEYLILGGQFSGQGGRWWLAGEGLSALPFPTRSPNSHAVQWLVERTTLLRTNMRSDPVPSPQLASPAPDQEEDWTWLLWVLGIGLAIAATTFCIRSRIISARTSRSPSAPGPGDYIALCPTCGKHRISEARTFWFLHGMVLAARYGTRTIAGCRYCVAEEGLKILAINALTGWFSVPWGLGTPVVILQNLCALILKPNTSGLESVFRRAGIDPSDVRLDARGLTNEQRSLVEAVSQILATAVWTDGLQRPQELKRALAILKQLTDDTIPERTLRTFITEGRNRIQDLTSLPPQLRQMLLEIAFSIAIVDGVLSLPEIAMLYRVSEILALGKSAVDHLLGLKAEKPRGEQDRSNRRSRGQRARADLQQALTILGLSQDATVIQVRQAWRSAILKFHPDRAGTDKKRQVEFTRRSQEINWAYDILQSDAAVA